MTEQRAKLYKTAYATVSCAKFKAGDCVAVKYSHLTSNGTLWFEINETQYGKLDYPVMYPEHQLTRFCF
jgi:hypothetical protein